MNDSIDSRFRTLLSGASDAPLVEADGCWIARSYFQNIAQHLLKSLDEHVPPDATIGLIARNRPQHLAALFALLSRRRAIAMLHAYQSPASLANEIRKLGLAAVIGDGEDWSQEVLEGATETGTLGLCLNGNMDKPLTRMAKIRDGEVWPSEPGLAIAMLTSGTTGAPKRVPISYDTLQDAVNDAGLATQQAGTPFGAAPYIQFYPLGNISGLYGLITCASHGQRVVLLEKFTVEKWVDAVATHRPTSFVSLPPAAIRMVMDADVPPDALSSIPAMRTGSAPLDPELQGAFEKRYDIPILINYGATEFCGVIANWTVDDHRRFAVAKRGSVGRARPGISLRITDPESGEVLAPGQIGRLDVLSPRLSTDWIATTDLAMIDEDGFLFLKGRADSMIIRGGFKVAPDEICDVLRGHPAIKEAAVVGVRDRRLGEVPVAAIELEEGHVAPGDAELDEFVRSRLSPQKVPVRFEVFDALPRTQSLKVNRGAVKSLLEDAG